MIRFSCKYTKKNNKYSNNPIFFVRTNAWCPPLAPPVWNILIRSINGVAGLTHWGVRNGSEPTVRRSFGSTTINTFVTKIPIIADCG